MTNKTDSKMEEKNENNAGLSIDTLKQLGYNYPYTARRIIESIERGENLNDINSGLINSRLATKQNGHILFIFTLSNMSLDSDEIWEHIQTERKDFIFFIDRKFVPSNDGRLLLKAFEAICDGKTTEEALERLKEEKIEKASRYGKIEEFCIRKDGDIVFFDIRTESGFLTVKAGVFGFQKVMPSTCCTYYDYTDSFVGKEFRTFIEAIKEAVIEITENIYDLHAEKEAPAPESNDTEGEKVRVSTDEIEVNNTAANSVDENLKKGAAVLKHNIEWSKDWWTQRINDIGLAGKGLEQAKAAQAAIERERVRARNCVIAEGPFEITLEEFEKAKAERAAKKETPCDLQCAVSFCKGIFEKKFGLYGASFIEMHPETVTDQLYMKVTILKKWLTDRDKKEIQDLAFFEVIRDEFAAAVNYGVIALRQAGFGVKGLSPDSPVRYHACKMQEALTLISDKGDEYGELWRKFRIGTFADMIYTKVQRLKSIENQYRVGGMKEEDYKRFAGDQYKDLINYGLFGVVRMTEIIDYLLLELEDYKSEGEEDETDEEE